MMKFISRAGVAGAIVMTAAVGAWANTQEPRPQPAATAVATVEGCLYKEVDVPGRHVPDEMRSRTVADEDYVLAKAQVVKGTAPAAKADAKPGDARAATNAMYKVKGSNLKLAAHAGHRVQVDGTFDHQDRAGNPAAFAFDLVILNGTALRQLPGDCPKGADK